MPTATLVAAPIAAATMTRAESIHSVAGEAERHLRYVGEGASPSGARINAMRHVLSKFDYDNKDHEVIGRPDPLIVGRALSD
jgi:hypothetical protein